MKINKYILFLSFCFIYILFYSGIDPADKKLLKPLTNDDYNYIAINEILMYISNNGDGSHDPVTDGNGFYWPGGKLARKSAIFEDGLIWGGKINGEIRVNGSTHRHGLQAGKILTGGVADNADDPKYRIYKIRKDWESLQQGSERDNYERDYNEWPVEDGAPWLDVDGDGLYSQGIDTPEFIGDEVLWYVSNDLDSSRSRFTYGSDPIGLEIQCLVWGYNKTNFLGDVVFKKYTIINKSTTTIDSMYLGLWTDDDLGDACDDFVGCDTLLNLGYSYNGDNDDGGGTGSTYGTPPPAVGHQFVQGPTVPGEPTDSARFKGQWVSGYKNLPITAFMLYIGPHSVFRDPYQGNYVGTLEFYNNLRGLLWNGNPLIDPHTGLVTKFIIPGDPVRGEGWYEGDGWPGGGESPDDRRFIMSFGPFAMAPGESQEVVIAILIAKGEDHIDSISELKRISQSVQIAYDLDFKTAPVMDKPHIKAVPHDQSLTLYWEPNAEEYDRVDPLLKNRVLGDSTYTFEGYRLWQFRDLAGNEPKLLQTFDLENNVVIIYESKIINGFPAEVVVINGPNEGVRRSYAISENIYDENPLNNGNPYYFAVTAYAFSENSDPSYVESEAEIIEVIPGLQKIDETFPYDSGEKIIAEHIFGNGDGTVELIVIDPNALTGDEYRVVFEGDGKENSYSFINYTTNDTIIADCTSFVIDTVGAPIIDGFILKIENTGFDKIIFYLNYGIKSVVEVRGPGGSDLEMPVNVIEGVNSTGDWQITSYGKYYDDTKQYINIHDAAGYHNYEIRFITIGSEYYLTGSHFGFYPWIYEDPKADDKVPFEIWDIGRYDSDTDDVRLTIKTLDDYASLPDDSNRVDQDGKWSRLENGDWEPIIAYFVDSTYSEPLPESSGIILQTSRFKIGKIIIRGELPAEGTVIRITTWKPLSAEDVFSVVATAPNTKDYAAAKTSLDDISVFPNPFLGTATFSGYSEQSFVRFTNLPAQVTVRIFSLAGVYVRRIEKNDDNPWLDWDLKNNAGEQVGSGVYIAHLEMPNIGEKVMKVAIIQENR